MMYFFEYITALILIAFAKILPVTISSWIACRFADLACILLTKRRKIAFENIERATSICLDYIKQERIEDEHMISSAKKIAQEQLRNVVSTSFHSGLLFSIDIKDKKTAGGIDTYLLGDKITCC